MGKKLKEKSKKSKAFQKFEHYFFGKDDTSKMLFHVLDPYTIDELDAEDKKQAEAMLKAALQEKFDRRWLWGLGEIGTDSAYEFVLGLYNKESAAGIKVNYAYTLILMNTKAPVLEYVKEILESSEPVDTRIRALGALYWLYDKPFDDKDRQQLYLSILFEAMVCRTKRLRLYAYDILKDHYGMKQFTPLDDPVSKILSLRRKKTEYQKAVQLFKDRIESIEVVPISRRVIVEWIRSLPNYPPAAKVTDCSTCRSIPDNLAANMAEGESLDAYKSKLEAAIKFAYYSNAVMRCPICGRLYIYKYEYEYLVGGSEEDEWLWRTDTKGAIELVDAFLEYYDFKKVVTCENFLKISY
ncbi:MAG: hypothetical protein EAX95_02910 [Candidatus Thorarchaeota archaeon]|nr:hypothetical protein [Candidatus Thorarchaeota archaeon]